VTATDVNGNVAAELIDVTVDFIEPELGCINEVNVTLDENCETTLIPEMVLAGNTVCLSEFDLDIVVMDSDTTNGAVIDGCGQFIYTIEAGDGSDGMVLENFLGCWGYVNAEDKTSPRIQDSIVAPAELFCVDLPTVNLNELPANVSRCFEVDAAGNVAAGFYFTALGQRLAAGSATGVIPGFFDGCSAMEICVN
ncbi:hypothetical protein CEQ90_20635, partial [Lewinellaceae bacterium SD302]